MFHFPPLLKLTSLLPAGRKAQQTNTRIGGLNEPGIHKVADAGFSIVCKFYQDIAFSTVS